MMRTLLTLLALFSWDAYSHARFRPDITAPDGKVTFKSNTPPRNDSTGLKSAPCGMVSRTSTPVVYKPGEEIEVQWEETINHEGYFIISFSKENDSNFEPLVKEFRDTQNTPVDSSKGEKHYYSAKVTLPNIDCEKCTLQLVQVMTEVPLNTDGTRKPAAFYYSCSDLSLREDSVTTPVPEAKPKPIEEKGDGSPKNGKPEKPSDVKVKKNT